MNDIVKFKYKLKKCSKTVVHNVDMSSLRAPSVVSGKKLLNNYW